MDQRRRFAFLNEGGASCSFSTKNMCVRKQDADLCQFFLNERCFLIGDADKNLSITGHFGFFQTIFQNGGAGSIGDLKFVAHILFTVKECMKRQEVERTVGHNRYMGRRDFADDRLEQISIKLT